MELAELVAGLKEMVGAENVLATEMERLLYSYDASLDRAKPWSRYDFERC